MSADSHHTAVEPSPEDDFAYPYHLHVPADVRRDRPVRPVVEPVNTGRPSDDLAVHREAARATAAGEHNGGLGHAVAERLGAPLVVPAFPRPVGEPAPLSTAVHALDRPTLATTTGPLARVDEQLLAMVADARERLRARGVATTAELALTGFSSSAQFVTRLAALHPDRVAAVSAGGHNGLVILPATEAETGRSIPGYEHRTLRYPVGVADLEELVGEPFDREAFRSVRLFAYLGAEDHRDALRWPDMWSDDELRATAVLTYGPEVHAHRVPTVAAHYRAADVPAVFRTYPETGHAPGPARGDVLAFHERCVAGADMEAIRATLGGEPVEPADRTLTPAGGSD